MRLFISYSRDDKTYVYALKDELQTDYPVWIDTQLVGGSQWWESILHEIEAADCVIAVLSQRAVDSIYCRAELDYALALNKPVLPLLIKTCDYPNSLNDRHIQYIDNTIAMDLQKLLRFIERAIGHIRLEIERGKFQPQSAPRPALPEPLPNAPEHAYEIFAAAEEAAAQDDLTLAESLFNKVMKADPQGLGLAAVERLSEIRAERDRAIAYLNVAKMAANSALLKGAKAAWRAYIQKHGGEYDPQNLAAKLNDAPPTVGTPRMASAAPTPQPVAHAPTSPLPPADSIIAALQRARTFTGTRNRDWQPVVTTFPDLKIPDIQFCLVPAGSFQMGEGKAAHPQTIEAPFWIAQFPVTNAQWARAVKAGVVEQPDNNTALNWYQDTTMTTAPVVGIDWFMARKFATWLGCRLPTEAEWEWAARGPENWMYPWGNKFDPNHLIYSDNSNRQPAPVGSDLRASGASWIGAHDMSGNVWEWCLNEYGDPDKTDIGGDARRVLRGGSWSDLLDLARAVFRFINHPASRFSDSGFRLVCVP